MNFPPSRLPVDLPGPRVRIGIALMLASRGRLRKRWPAAHGKNAAGERRLHRRSHRSIRRNRAARRAAHRRLRLAAPQGLARGARVSARRERVHVRRRCGRPRRCRARCTRRFSGASSRPIRRRRCGAALPVLLAHDRGQAVPDVLPQARRRRRATEEVLLDLNALAQAQKFLGLGAISSCPTTATCSPTRSTPPAFASTRCTSRTCARASCCPSASPKVDLGRAGPPTAGRCSTRSRTPPSARTGCTATCSAARRRRARLRGEGRALLARRLAHAQQGVPAADLRQPHHERGALRPADAPEQALRVIAARRDDARVLRRSPRRAVLHPHQRPRPQLPPGHRARRPTRRGAAGRS